MNKILWMIFVCFFFGSCSSNRTIFEIAKDGTPEELKAAIKSGARVNARDEKGLAPLHEAAFFNKNPDVVLALLKLGANPKARGTYGQTPWDLIKENASLINTEAYRVLYSARHE